MRRISRTTHGYATTLHKAQGATLDQAFVLADDTVTRQRGYSAMSRGTDRNDLYTVTDDDEREDVKHAAEVEADPLEQLWTTLARSQPKTMAVDELRRGMRRRVKIGESVDLGTVDLSNHRRRSGLERRIEDALGFRARDIPDAASPPLPARGIDGPDIGW